jgi:hypothetical protein
MINGSLDESFGGDGIVTTGSNSPFSLSYAVTIQPDGKILAAGITHNGSNDDFGLARFHADGVLDNTFGNGDGVTSADFGTSGELAYAVAIDSSGLAVLAGVAEGKFALARFLLDQASIGVSVSGVVKGPDGRGLRGVMVSITSAAGETRFAASSSLGFYSFQNVQSGPYTVRASSKRFRFDTRHVDLTGNISNLDLVGME